MLPGVPTRFPQITGADLIALLPLLLAGLAVFLGLVVGITARRLRRPPRRTYAWAVSKGVPGDPGELDEPLAFTDQTLTLAGREVCVWEITGLDPDGPAVVLTHGWGESRVHALARARAAAAHASRVLAWDLPGHGDSPGPTTLGIIEPRCLAELVRAQPDDAPIVLWGWSLGVEVSLRAAPALHAAGCPLRGLVLESGYARGVTPARNVLRAVGMPSGFTLDLALAAIGTAGGQPRHRFRDLTEIAALSRGTPALVLHGEGDTISPIEDGRSLARALNGEFEELPGTGHSDLWTGEQRGRVSGAVDRFLARLGERGDPREETARTRSTPPA
jgi:pimeloyl-ACP methyl ester carboxylesterase